VSRAEAAPSLESAAAEQVDRAADRLPAKTRVASVDMLRGITVLGMIIVNTAGYLHDPMGFPAYPVLLHAAWAGFTLADAVFPSFILIVGLSIAFSMSRAQAGDAAARRKAVRSLLARTARLLIVGFMIANLFWLQTPDDAHIRVFGVLQRIGLVYFACSALYLSTGLRTRLVLAVVVLLAYWPFTLLPTPDGPARLMSPGDNIVSWAERALLGVHIYVHGAHGYDPEGLLSTLPAIAQGLLGTVVGQWMINRGPSISAARTLAWSGALVAAAGALWCAVYPPIKSIWTSSFVLISTGPTLMLLGLLYWRIDIKGMKPFGYAVAMAFGMNAITAYVLHEVGSVVLLSSPFRRAYFAAATVLPPEAAALAPVAIFTILVWIPIGWFYHKRWIVKI
jgi:predicted acyltransferase